MLALHLEERELLQQVDAPHFHTPLHMTVDELDNFRRHDAVHPSGSDEHAGIASLSLPRALAGTATRTLFLLFLRRHHYLRSVSVVLRKPSVLPAQQPGYQVLLGKPLQALHHPVHELPYMFLVHLHPFQVVYHLVELLLADHVARGKGSPLEGLAYDFLDVLQPVLLLQVHDGDALPLLPGTARTTAAVGIYLYIVRQSVVDYMRQVVHVYSSGSHIGSHQQLRIVLTELLHGQVALLLGQLPVQRIGIIAIVDKVVGHLLRFQTGTAEHYTVDTGVVVHHPLQGQVLVLSLHHIRHMLHVLRPLVALSYHYLLVSTQVVLRYLADFLAHGGREHQFPHALGHMTQDVVQVLREAHRQHLVGLIQHHSDDPVQAHRPPAKQVQQAPRSSHHYLDVVPAQRLNLRFYG